MEGMVRWGGINRGARDVHSGRRWQAQVPWRIRANAKPKTGSHLSQSDERAQVMPSESQAPNRLMLRWALLNAEGVRGGGCTCCGVRGALRFRPCSRYGRGPGIGAHASHRPSALSLGPSCSAPRTPGEHGSRSELRAGHRRCAPCLGSRSAMRAGADPQRDARQRWQWEGRACNVVKPGWACTTCTNCVPSCMATSSASAQDSSE